MEAIYERSHGKLTNSMPLLQWNTFICPSHSGRKRNSLPCAVQPDIQSLPQEVFHKQMIFSVQGTSPFPMPVLFGEKNEFANSCSSNFRRFHCGMCCTPFHYKAPHKNQTIFLVDFGSKPPSDCRVATCYAHCVLTWFSALYISSFLLTGTAKSRISYSPCCPCDTCITCAFPRPCVV